jgi:hypothetical protein
MTKRIFTIIFVLTISFIGCYAQNWLLMRYEAHFGIGTTNVFGDIGGTMDKNNLYGLKDIKIKETGPSFYLGIRYKLTERQALKLNLIYGSAASSDEGARNFDRKFSFKTHLFEPSIQYEYYIITDSRNYSVAKLYNRRGMINNYSLLSFYVFGGIGGVFFSPTLTYGGRQPEKGVEFVDGYSKISAVIPIGLGLKINYNKLWAIGFELGRRFAFTDYLDGISTIYSKDNDTYYFANIHLIYKLECDRYGRPYIFGRRKYRPN